MTTDEKTTVIAAQAENNTDSKPEKDSFGGSAAKQWFDRYASQVMILTAEIVLIVFFSFMSPYFFTLENFSGLILDGSVYVLLALGLVFVIATGGIDLTPGFGIAFTSVCMAWVIVHVPGSTPVKIILGILVGILSGTLLGCVNGFLVAYLRMQPMIATLAMMLVAWGSALVITGTSAIVLSDYPQIGWLGKEQTVLWHGESGPVGFTNAVYLMIPAVIVAHILLNKTLIGRYALAIGSNEEATKLSGVNVRAWKFRVYALGGTFTGLAGVLMASKLGSGKPDVGQSYEMYAIAAAVLGGASLQGGRADAVGAAIGAIVIATIRNGCVIMGVPEELQKILLGIVVLAAVYLDVRRGDN